MTINTINDICHFFIIKGVKGVLFCVVVVIAEKRSIGHHDSGTIELPEAKLADLALYFATTGFLPTNLPSPGDIVICARSFTIKNVIRSREIFNGSLILDYKPLQNTGS